MLQPCPSCKAELSAALVGADGRCPYCGTKAVLGAAEPEARKKPAPAFVDNDDTVPAPRAKSTAQATPPSLLEIDGPPIAFSSAFESVLPPGWGGLKVGARGILFGKAASAAGRVHYRVENPRTVGWWDAWAIRFGDGADGWLLDRAGALAIVRPFTPPAPVAFEDLREGMLVRFERGPPATVIDLGTAVVKGTEGVTDFTKGLRVRFATLAGDGGRFHYQWTEGRPFEAYRGDALDPSMMAAGFALRAPSGFRDSAATSFSWFTNMPPWLQITLVLLAIPAIAGLGLVVLFDRIAAAIR